MTDGNYRVVFRGEITGGANPDGVKKRLKAAFNTDNKRINKLFSGRSVFIKKNASLQDCEKIKLAFEKTGALCFIEKQADIKTPERLIQGSKETCSSVINSKPPPINDNFNTTKIIKKKRVFFFFGCLTAAAIGVLFVLILTYGVLKLKELGISYTDTKPTTFETIDIPPEELAMLTEKIYNYSTLISKGDDTAILMLSAREVNALISTYREFKDIKDRFRFSFQDDKIIGNVSIPLDIFFKNLGKGRYLNGSASFLISSGDGSIFIGLDDLVIKDKKIPDVIMSGLKNTNLAADMHNDAETSKLIQRIKHIEVRDEKLYIETLSAKEVGTGFY